MIYLKGEDGHYVEVDRFGPEAYAFYDRRERFGSRPPTGLALLNLSVKGAAQGIAHLDRDLVDEVLALDRSELLSAEPSSGNRPGYPADGDSRIRRSR
ncbi:hypothetical protein [Nocardia sp. NPDC050717]|uniref:hypothetical protein n=1 Tax=Nocardia sp. NPDC050717 TaxID=3157221 RepID=UPI0033F367D2